MGVVRALDTAGLTSTVATYVVALLPKVAYVPICTLMVIVLLLVGACSAVAESYLRKM